RPRRLDLVVHHLRRLTVRADRRIDAAALVEHPHDRELLGVELTLRADHLATTRLQPLRRMGAQLVDQHVEHELIQPRGYDTHRPDGIEPMHARRTGRRARPLRIRAARTETSEEVPLELDHGPRDSAEYRTHGHGQEKFDHLRSDRY